MHDVEHHFICLFAICISSLVGCLLRSLAHFLIRLFIFLLLSFKGSLHILVNSRLSDMYFYKYFPPIYDMSSHSLNIVFHRAEVLILKKSSLSIISFMDHVFGVVSKKISPYSRSWVFSYVIFQEFYSFAFYILDPFEFIFVKGVRPVCGLILCRWIFSYSSAI